MLTDNDRKQFDKLKDEMYAARCLPMSANKRRVYPGAKVKFGCQQYKVKAVMDNSCIMLERRIGRTIVETKDLRAELVTVVT
jgi:hypothetical protein